MCSKISMLQGKGDKDSEYTEDVNENWTEKREGGGKVQGERVIEWLKDGSEQRTRRSQGARGESPG